METPRQAQRQAPAISTRVSKKSRERGVVSDMKNQLQYHSGSRSDLPGFSGGQRPDPRGLEPAVRSEE